MDWERPLALREPTRHREGPPDLAADVRFHAWVQWVFFDQWDATASSTPTSAASRSSATSRSSSRSTAPTSGSTAICSRWTRRGQPTVVAGVPPDAFSQTGQRWGNPLYDWDKMAKDGYRWWLDRFRATLELVDTVRLDHFRGFAAYWEVPAAEETAINGSLGAGPGPGALRRASRPSLGRIPMIVEDLGEITPDVIALREELGLPGHEGAPVRVRRRRRGRPEGREPVPAAQLHARLRRLHRHPRQRHDGRLAGEPARRRAGVGAALPRAPMAAGSPAT